MSASLEGTAAVVTGGARGIGFAIASRLAAAGARVAILDRDEEPAREAAASLKGAIAVAADVTDYQAVAAALSRAARAQGAPGVLVNNAGWDRVQPFLDNEPALWTRLVEVNLLGVFNATHAALPAMIERGGGRIVNIASDAGRVGSSGEAVYSACKGGVIAFTKAIAREVARSSVAVNCVCPGPTATPLLEEIRSEDANDRLIEAIVRSTPTRRLALPEEIAEAVAFFASGPDHVTGQVLSVSGGLTMAG